MEMEMGSKYELGSGKGNNGVRGFDMDLFPRIIIWANSPFNFSCVPGTPDQRYYLFPFFGLFIYLIISLFTHFHSPET